MKTKLVFLGVGNGGTMDLYNTCFVIQNEKGDFLVDTGGSIEIIKRLGLAGIDYRMIKHIFISHSHTDHILGLFWYFKKISQYLKGKNDIEKINIYCNDVVYQSIKEIAKYILPSSLMDIIYSHFNFHILNDNDRYSINGVDYTFFDIMAKGTKQFGFECVLSNKTFAFLGDETLNPVLYEKIKNYDYVTHEAFCLKKEENIFHAYEKNHSTTKSVSEVMNKLNIKNLILYHTEDTHGDQRQELYLDEAKDYFNGKVYVPNDMEEIEIL